MRSVLAARVLGLVSLLTVPLLAQERPAPAEATFGGRTIQQWIEHLRSPDKQERREALRALREMKDRAAPALPTLLELLGTLKQESHQALTRKPTSKPPVIDEELPEDEFAESRKTSSSVTDARWELVLTLGEIGPAARSAVPALLELLRDPEPAIRWASAEALASLASLGEPALSGLLEAIQDRGHPESRCAAAYGLGLTKARDTRIGTALVSMLEDPEVECRGAAASAIARRGAGLIPAVKGVLFGEHPPAIRAAAAALGWMGDAGVASLSEALHHAKGPGRSAAGWVLSGRPERVPGLAQALVETLTEKDPAVRETAVRALTRIGRVDRETEAALLRVTNDPSIRVRIAVLRSLETFQHLGSEADEALARALRDPERAIRRPAIGVLGTRALGNPANATLLVGALRDPDPELRARAASALWDVQPLPVEAIHALERLRDDPDQSVRSCALRLLTGN